MKRIIKYIILLCFCFLLGIISTIGFTILKKNNDNRNFNKNINNFHRTNSEMYEEFKLPSNAPKCNDKENIYNGSKEYYNELRKYYFKIGFYKFFSWALFMANKYNYPQAYFDVYYSLYDLNTLGKYKKDNNMSLDKLDKKTQKLAIEYLTKATEKGHNQAKEILGKYYLEGKYVNKNIPLGNKLIKESKGNTPKMEKFKK